MTEAVWEPKEGILPAAGSRFPDVRFDVPASGWRLAEGLLAVGVLTTLIVAGSLDRMPHGFEDYLAVRISLKNAALLAAFGLAWPNILSMCGLYAPARLRRGTGEWPRLFLAGAIGSALAMVVPLTSRSGVVSPAQVLLFALTIAPAEAALRGAVRTARRATRNGRHRQVVVVGSGPLAARMSCELWSDPLCTDEIIGFVDSEPTFRSPCEACGSRRRRDCRCSEAQRAGPARLGDVAGLERVLMNRVVDEVVIAVPIKSHYEDIQQTLAACAHVGVPARYPANLFRRSLDVSMAEAALGSPVLSLAVAPHDYRMAIKRLMDVASAALLIVLLLPVMLAVALAVKLTSPGPVFFAQERYGLMKRRFRMLKFRTMVAEAEQLQLELEGRNEATGPVFKIRDDPRVTRLGRFLRRTSLDELPQLWHVLTGEMSLVGPRPLPIRDVGRFPEPWLMRRFSVRPGLTCLWQIRGRITLSFDQWIAMDLEYIDRWSPWLDLKILLRTPAAVISGIGAA